LTEFDFEENIYKPIAPLCGKEFSNGKTFFFIHLRRLLIRFSLFRKEIFSQTFGKRRLKSLSNV